MIQNDRFEMLKRLCDEAGIDDWVGEIDHTATYQSNKQKIMNRYGLSGFEVDQEQKLKKLEAEAEDREAEAPEDAPTSFEEQMRQQSGGTKRPADTIEVDSIDGSSEQPAKNKQQNTQSNKLPSGRQSQKSQISASASLSLSQVRDKCLKAIEEAYAETQPVLIDALPGTGKSYAAVEAASATETPITILTSRGRKGRYAEIESWCQTHGLSSKILPNADEDCPTFDGKHGPQLKRRFKKYRELGITVSDLHAHWNPPCQNGSACPYQAAWNFQPENYDVIIGHYTHAYVEKVIENRVVVSDEIPSDAFLTKFEDLQTTITNFLQQTSGIPFPNYFSLISNNDSKNTELALNWFENRGINIGGSKQILDPTTTDYHIHAPLLVLGILVSEPLGNNWSRASLGGGQVFAHNQNGNEMSVLTPPTLTNAKNVIALDGTPTLRLYDLMFNVGFEQKQVLSDSEREEYIRNTQNLKIVQTELKYIRPYTSGNNVNVDRDEALLREVIAVHGDDPAVISSDRALGKLKARNIPMSPNSTHYGNLRGSNKLAKEDVGVILGSPHYGDEFIERWAALFGFEASGSKSGTAKSYGAFGDELLQHMRENEVLQAIFRFARDGSGATVYVNTGAIPPWLPREIALGVSRTRKSTERDIIDVLSRMGTVSGTEIATKVDKHPNTVRSHLRTLQKEGVVRKTGNNKGTQWHDDGLSSANKYGAVDLNSITNKTYKIPIREIGDKIELKDELDRHLEQYDIDQAERDRLIGDMVMTDHRTEQT
ncbi:winged helix-turn-helix transcriptional regulator [Salarchaeum japonicum]|uniref:winged helix-turn-helix transcriptional regulator n=1 Tax=Salarchaeum japonicum TaxID=555573 RepID=UPI003C76A598